jgi:hypothetical protein
MRDGISLIMDSRINREREMESTFGVTVKFDSQINSEEIWYGSRGLHLFGAPICVFKI